MVLAHSSMHQPARLDERQAVSMFHVTWHGSGLPVHACRH